MATAPKIRNSRLPALKRKADINAAAREAIAEKGHENISLSDIAQRAGIVEGTLYRFYTNKQDLLINVVAEWYKEITDASPGVENVRGTWNKLRGLIARDLKIIKDNPEFTRFILTVVRPDPTYKNSIFYQLNLRYTDEIRDLCKEAVESGEFREDVSPKLLRDMIFGCIEHSTWAYLRGTGDFSVDETADSLAYVIYRGMIKEQEPAPDKSAAIVDQINEIKAGIERIEKKITSQ